MRIGNRVGLVALSIVLLAGCAPQPDVDDGETLAPTVEPAPSASATEAPAEPVFAMPDRCVDILTPETQSLFAESGMDLLGGPGGTYGENYFGDPTQEELAGGITCVWGDEDVLASTVIVSVAPITTANRSGIISTLIGNGLVESQIDGGLTYARIGDEVSAPAELNVIRTESWISVIEAVGGEARFQQATELVDEVSEQVYVAG